MRLCFARIRNTTRYRGPLTDIVDGALECIKAYIAARPEHAASFYRLSLRNRLPDSDPSAIAQADVVVLISEAEFAWQTKGLKQPLHVDQSNARLASIAPLFQGKPIVLLTFDRADTPALFRERTFAGIEVGPIGEIDEADHAFHPGLGGMKYWFIRERAGPPPPGSARDIRFCYWGAANKRKLPDGALSGDERGEVLRALRKWLPPPRSYFIGSFPFKDTGFTRDFESIVPAGQRSRYTLCFNWLDPSALTSRYFEAVALGMVPLAWKDYGYGTVPRWTRMTSIEQALAFMGGLDRFDESQPMIDAHLRKLLPSLDEYKRRFAARMDEELFKVKGAQAWPKKILRKMAAR